jgi:hypothetical protein
MKRRRLSGVLFTISATGSSSIIVHNCLIPSSLLIFIGTKLVLKIGIFRVGGWGTDRFGLRRWGEDRQDCGCTYIHCALRGELICSNFAEDIWSCGAEGSGVPAGAPSGNELRGENTKPEPTHARCAISSLNNRPSGPLLRVLSG